jgi:hypothetical protein
VYAADLRLKAGQQLLAGYEMSPGKVRHFCRVCASPIFSSNTQTPDKLRLRLGILDSDIVERPSSHNFVSSKANWEEFDAELPHYNGHEPDRQVVT